MRLTVSNAIKLTRNNQKSSNERGRLSRGDIHRRNTVFGNDGTWEAAVWSAGQEFSFQEGQHVKRPAPQSLAAEIDRIREIDAAFIFGAAPCGVSLPGSSLCKVEDDKGGKDLLKEQFWPLGMEVDHAHGIL